MKCPDYLDALKERLNVQSDYAVAKQLQVHPNRISNYRCGRSNFDSDLVPKVAELLGISPLIIFADMGGARAKDDFERECFKELAELARAQKKSLSVKTNQAESVLGDHTCNCRTQ